MATSKAQSRVISLTQHLAPDACTRLRAVCSSGPRLTAPFRAVGRLVCIGGLLGACGEAPAGRNEVPGAVREAPAGVVDWSRRVVSLGSPGWSVEFCEGEGPFLCVARGNEPAGSVEMLRLPVRDHAVIAAVLGRGGSEREALEAAAAEFLAILADDRRTGVDRDYQMRADPPAAVSVLGEPGLRLVLEGRLADRVQERIVQYQVIHRDTLYLLSATGSAGGGSMGDFAIDDLIAFEPVFGRVAAASRVTPTRR